MNKVQGISIAKNGIAHIKSPVVLLHREPNTIEPLVYFRKPRNITDKQFESIVADLSSQIVGLNTQSVALLEEEL